MRKGGFAEHSNRGALPLRRASRTESAHDGDAVQLMYTVVGGAIQTLTLPRASTCVLPGIPWGAFDELLTPAFWRGQAWQHDLLGTYRDLRLGRTLIEELAACLLGGFGMRAELGLTAFSRLRDRGLLVGCPSPQALEAVLSEPFIIDGRSRGYRFPRQKARYLSACLRQLDQVEPHASDVALRDQLALLPGIGLKTASWIVRNHRGSSQVAIIDVHILRAGRRMGLFTEAQQPQDHYRELEAAFLKFADAIEVPAARLDALMWDYMRRFSASIPAAPALRALNAGAQARRPPSRQRPGAVRAPG